MSYLLILCGIYLILESIYCAQHVDRTSRLCTLFKLIFIMLAGSNAIRCGWLMISYKAPLPWGFFFAICAVVLSLLPVTYYRFTSKYDRRGL